MRIMVIGVGGVGSRVVEQLHREHEIVAIDRDEGHCGAISYRYDIMAIRGNGASLRVLKQAGIEETDMVIASTNVDEVNFVASVIAKQLGVPKTIARVHDPEYLETWKANRRGLGVDFMVCSEVVTAEVIARIIGMPEADYVDLFADGRIQMVELKVSEGSPLAGLRIVEAKVPRPCMIVSILRGEEVIIPRGDDRIQAGDRVVVIGTGEAAGPFIRKLSDRRERARDVVIIGGGRIGFKMAQMLESTGLKLRVIERDEERSEFIASELHRTLVLRNDGTDLDFLEREKVGEADVVVSVVDSDEKNLLSSLLVKKLGANKTIAVVANPDFAELFAAVGVDVVISPHILMAEQIIRFTRGPKIGAVSLIGTDKAEVLQMEVSASSQISGKPLKAVTFPYGSIIGAIVRDGQAIVPDGEATLQPGDTIIVFSKKEQVKAVEALL
ncbi:MAG: Trk system potassium transporter TrkA [Candidatus Bipolaricaulia bacterium]